MKPHRNFKFHWAGVVSLDGRLSITERFILDQIARYYVRNGEDWFKRRQTTIATKFSVSTDSVKVALAAGRKYGYLVLHEPRLRGPGGTANSYRLVLPPVELDEPTADPVDNSVDNSELGCYDRRNVGVVIADNCGGSSGELRRWPNAPTSGNAIPSSGSLGDVGRGEFSSSAEAPNSANPEPPLKCPKHLNNPNPPDCRKCQKAREENEAWKEKQDAIQAETNAVIRALIDNCTAGCDSAGRDDDLNDCPHHPNFRNASA